MTVFGVSIQLHPMLRTELVFAARPTQLDAKDDVQGFAVVVIVLAVMPRFTTVTVTADTGVVVMVVKSVSVL